MEKIKKNIKNKVIGKETHYAYKGRGKDTTGK